MVVTRDIFVITRKMNDLRTLVTACAVWVWSGGYLPAFVEFVYCCTSDPDPYHINVSM